MRKISVTIEMEIDEQPLQEYQISDQELLDSIRASTEDFVDGCEIDIDLPPSIDPAVRVLRNSVRLVSKEILDANEV